MAATLSARLSHALNTAAISFFPLALVNACPEMVPREARSLDFVVPIYVIFLGFLRVVKRSSLSSPHSPSLLLASLTWSASPRPFLTRARFFRRERRNYERPLLRVLPSRRLPEEDSCQIRRSPLSPVPSRPLITRSADRFPFFPISPGDGHSPRRGNAPINCSSSPWKRVFVGTSRESRVGANRGFLCWIDRLKVVGDFGEISPIL
uniref:Transmembrane protein n=1 Tax=Steinernema glaseri TaxID=37863 RepID=A0A1I8A5K4_9BILA